MLKKPKKKRKKRRVKTSEQIEYDRLLKECDRIWSELVLKRDKHIDHYRMKRAVVAHHILSRSYFPCRWLLLNGISLAQGTHGYDAHGKGRAEFDRWIQRKWLGQEQWENLYTRKNNYMKRCIETLKVVKISLERQREQSTKEKP